MANPAENVDFFFSSRRRHTRSKRDWSSDVCSSDLIEFRHFRKVGRGVGHLVLVSGNDTEGEEIGRASCRERVQRWGGALCGTKKNNGDVSNSSMSLPQTELIFSDVTQH